MTELEWLADLVRRVPVLHVNLAQAKASGDFDRLTYARAMARWLDEVTVAVAEAEAAASRREGVGRVESDEARGFRPQGKLPPELVLSRFHGASHG